MATKSVDLVSTYASLGNSTSNPFANWSEDVATQYVRYQDGLNKLIAYRIDASEYDSVA